MTVISLSFSRALVTGGAGFVGSHITDRLVKEGVHVTILDDFSGGKMSNLSESIDSRRVTLVKGNVRDRDLARRVLKGIEIAFHEAAIVNVQRTMTEPELTHAVNVGGTKNMLEASADCGVKRFIFASTGAVYGDSPILPRSERMSPTPISPYGKSKLEAEDFCRDIGSTRGLETVRLRYFNIYGVRSTSKAYSGAINVFAQRFLNGEKPIIYGDGSQSRDFISIRDIVDANLLAASSDNATGKVFNVGTGKKTTILQLVSIIKEGLLGDPGLEDAVEFKPFRDGDVKHSYADISLIRGELGFDPKVAVQSGLEDYLKDVYGTEAREHPQLP